MVDKNSKSCNSLQITSAYAFFNAVKQKWIKKNIIFFLIDGHVISSDER